MKTIITIIITIVVLVPVLSYAVTGLVQYQGLNLNIFGSTVNKFYDHDEGVVCYTITDYGISCIKDN